MKFFLFLLLLSALLRANDAVRGSVSLDSISFEKIVSKFKASLVKFDIQYPYGDKHEHFERVSKMAFNPELVVAEVGVQEFGDKENMDLADRYGVKKDDLPVIKLFIDGDLDHPIDFSGEFKSDSIINFVRKHSGLRILLENCLEKFDELAERFMSADIGKDEQSVIVSEAKHGLDELTSEDQKKSADIYVKLMEKVMERGNKFIDSEIERVDNLMTGKVSDTKKADMKRRLNILQSFTTPGLGSQAFKTEL